MNILIMNPGIIPAHKYGGTERVIWYLGKELAKLGHTITFLVSKGSYCNFATVQFFDSTKSLSEQIPHSIDIVHFNVQPAEPISKPYIVTIHGNVNDLRAFDANTVFVSKNHANRFGSDSFVYNGLDWNDYGKPNLLNKRRYFHFLGKAGWRVKNVKGAIDVIKSTQKEKLKVLGGYRLNFKMGFRLTLNPRITFSGMVGGDKKNKLLQESKGLLFPVRWHEPFGLALIESLYFGCPVLGTPYGSLPEIVHEEVGFLSNNGEELARETKNIERFSKQRCHDYVVDVFNSKKMAEAYVDKYWKVLNGETLNQALPKLLKVQAEKFLEWR
jgi:glycosyltransferase involved in cell wall biosynthesis